MPPACLTLLVPELLWPEPGGSGHRETSGTPETFDSPDFPACPALAALLARGRFSRRPPQASENLLTELFGHASDVSRAALRLRGESEVPPDADADASAARWLAADPVHLRFHQNRLILAGGAALAITREEAAALTDALNGYFAALGHFHAASADRWYLRLTPGTEEDTGRNTLERIGTPPLSAVAGRSVEHTLAEITEKREALGLLNEIQTFLHAHPVNRHREDKGLMPVNSLWLWGGGISPMQSSSPSPPPSPAVPESDVRFDARFDTVWSDDPLAIGLARAAGVPAYPVPDDAARLLASPSTRPLAVLDGLGEAVRYENGADYAQALAALETHWFAPAWQALTNGTIGRLCLLAPTAYGVLRWEAGRADFWRFWRRPKTLAETIRAVAALPGEAAGEAR